MTDITEADFNTWKHHPVTKFYLQFLKDFERDADETILMSLRSAKTAPDGFELGQITGFANAIRDMATLEFSHIARFYAPPEQEETQEQED